VADVGNGTFFFTDDFIYDKPETGWPQDGFTVTFTVKPNGAPGNTAVAVTKCQRTVVLHHTLTVQPDTVDRPCVRCVCACVCGGVHMSWCVHCACPVLDCRSLLLPNLAQILLWVLDHLHWQPECASVLLCPLVLCTADGCARTATTFVGTDAPLTFTATVQGAAVTGICNSESGPATATVQFVGDTDPAAAPVTQVPGSFSVTAGVQCDSGSGGGEGHASLRDACQVGALAMKTHCA
jgi:hypothetical protein